MPYWERTIITVKKMTVAVGETLLRRNTDIDRAEIEGMLDLLEEMGYFCHV